MDKPVVSITLGDVCGIAPEVVVKALTTESPQKLCTPLVIGSHHAFQQAIDLVEADLPFTVIKSTDAIQKDCEKIQVLDTGALDPDAIQYGRINVDCGRANGVWLQQAAELCANEVTGASVMAPVTAEALTKAKVDVRSFLATDPTKRFLTLVSGPLRVVHVFDHVMLEDICREISEEIVLGAISKTNEALIDWGISAPRIGVAGFNPHAHGPQEEQAIVPAVKAAQSSGIDATGPIAPDTIFRQCIDGKYDVVVAMFHDQGHIAIKTWGFSGNSAIFLGAPYLLLSVGHGSAHDIAGQGIADHSMILSAMQQAASLAARKGFFAHDAEQV